MATLYEIDTQILDCIDTESGEIIDEAKLNALQIERDQKIENVALWVKNLESDAAAYKAEKEAFDAKEKAAKNKAESLRNWLTYALDGQKLKTTKVNVTYRKSESVYIENEEAFIEYAERIDRDDLLTYKAPTPNKTAIKAELKNGVELFGCALVEKQNIQIK